MVKKDGLLDRTLKWAVSYKIAKFLNIELANTKYVYISLWTFVHLICGIAFFFIWNIFSNNLLSGFWLWLLIHILWEVLEYILAEKLNYKLLFVESLADKTWDIIFDMIGYMIPWLIYIR